MRFTASERRMMEKYNMDFSVGYATVKTNSGKTAMVESNFGAVNHFSLFLVEEKKMVCTRARLDTIVNKLETL